MKLKQLRTFVYVIIALLFIVFVVSWVISSRSHGLIDFVSTVSGLSAFFVAILTAVTLYTTSTQIDLASKQLSEMEHERTTREQPLLTTTSELFEIEQPQLFYTPPEDKHKFLSRFSCSCSIINNSAYPAVSVDISATLTIPRGNGEDNNCYVLTSSARRINILDSKSESEEITIPFHTDNAGCIFESLRDTRASGLPQLQITLNYKNLCGAYYKSQKSFYIAPDEEDDKAIRHWHTSLTSAPVEYKEVLQRLSKMPKNSEWQTLFGNVKSAFSSDFDEPPILFLKCIEIPASFEIGSITKKEFEADVSSHRYGRYVHKAPSCTPTKD